MYVCALFSARAQQFLNKYFSQLVAKLLILAKIAFFCCCWHVFFTQLAMEANNFCCCCCFYFHCRNCRKRSCWFHMHNIWGFCFKFSRIFYRYSRPQQQRDPQNHHLAATNQFFMCTPLPLAQQTHRSTYTYAHINVCLYVCCLRSVSVGRLTTIITIHTHTRSGSMPA